MIKIFTIGGLLGTLGASYYANGINNFKSIPEILRDDATPEQREKLVIAIKDIMSAENLYTLTAFVAALSNDVMLKETISQVVREFLRSDMGLSVL